MKIGLVLEGGAMRGMYTAGIIDTFMEHSIPFDCAVGTSAGALFGVNYKSGQIGRVIRYNKKYNGDKNYMGIRPLLREGNIVSTKFAYHIVPEKLDPFDDEAYKSSPMNFFACTTNIESGDAEYFEIKSVFEQMDTLRASGSMPFVSKPVEIDGKLYLDGGVADSIPYEWASRELCCDKLVVVLTRDKDYRKEPTSQKLTKLFYRKYPNLCKRIINRYKEYNDSVEKLAQWEKEGKVFVLRPTTPIEINKIEKDPEKLQAVYDLGVKDAEERMEELLAYLGK